MHRYFFVFAILLAPAALHAQGVPLTSGPRIEAARVGIEPARTERGLAADPAAGPRLAESTALMIVGVAALVAGLIIGGGAGTVLAVGGTVLGLVGLYQYLR